MSPLQPVPYGSLLASNLRAVRAAANLSQSDVAERMRALGFTAWLRSTVSLSEQGKRRVTAEELLGLALVVDTGMVRVAEPPEESPWIELPGGQRVHRSAVRGPGEVQWDGNTPIFMRDVAGFGAHVPGVQAHAEASQPIPVEETLEQPVATAIVTSELGVLVGKRNDGKPPWTFIAGEVEPGEAPADAAIREVKEETGLRVKLAEVIGERVHPKTGRTMIYIAATPTHGTDVIVGDEEELAEVRWVSLAEADELMAAYGMFEPVHDYLTAKLGEA